MRENGGIEPAVVGSVEHWRVAAASVQGLSHERHGATCQDAYTWERLSSGGLLVVVADGAGSAPHGQIGATVAARAAAGSISAKWANPPTLGHDGEWIALLHEALTAALGAVEIEAQERGSSLRELATTLIVVVATSDQVAAIQVGDGAVVIGDTAEPIVALTVPQRGEYLNETVFLVSPDALETAQVRLWRGQPTHLAVFSDGLQMLALKMPEGTPHPPFFRPLFRFIAQESDENRASERLQQFLLSERVREHTDDDLTLLVAVLFR